MKKYWDTHFPGGKYDAVGRRRGLVASTTVSGNSGEVSPIRKLPKTNAGPVQSHAVRGAMLKGNHIGGSGGMTAAATPMTPSSVGQLQQQVVTLNRNIVELRSSMDELEKERDFYFNKLREIELATQQVSDQAILQSSLFKEVTEILYKTEDGFEIPSTTSTADPQGKSGEAVSAQ